MSDGLGQIGRYRLERVLGSGGMGVVHLATDTALGRQVAIKSVRLQNSAEEYQWMHDRLFREARAAAVLSHRSIIAIHDIFEESGLAHIVMEYGGGATLEKAMSERSLPRERTLQILASCADALDYAHQRGIIHRDVKPANLILGEDGAVKVADFGIAKVVSATTQTATGMVLGTAQYMSPEQFRAQKVDGRTDQFSLAVIAYKMLTSRVLFPDADSLASLSYKICHEEPELPSTVAPGLPRAVDAVFQRALAKDPAGRFPTCAAFVEALGKALTPTVVAEPPPVVAAPPVVKPAPAPVMKAAPTREKPAWVWAAASGAAVLGVVGVGAWMMRGSGTPPSGQLPKPPAAEAKKSAGGETEQPVQVKRFAREEHKGPVVKEAVKKDLPLAKKGGSEAVKAEAVKKEQPEVKGEAKTEDQPAAPASGQMVWTGLLDAGEELSIAPGATGLNGSPLPGVPVKIAITPEVVEIVSAPSASTGWRKFTIRNISARRQTLLIIKWNTTPAK